ncbi:hypothetical protein VSDG_02255 [Cytospora chrysosperma]|uniref:N-acetyltransferase domain-containing protein n=1 Tax=Cytospora chrysosperma TaxID=252740 RepID=A0A423WDW3_CYTCH|nr:hypothetical protein VSDG_02255 [Valsa sordida]
MAPVVNDLPAPAKHADFAILNDHLPQTITLLRRLQFTHLPQDAIEHAHYLFASDPNDPPGSQGRGHFAAAHLDFTKGPETELYFYSTLEDYKGLDGLSEGEVEHILDIIVALFQRVKSIAESTLSSGAHKLFREHGVMVGGLHQPTYELLCERRGFKSSYWNPHDAWLFRLDRFPVLSEGLTSLQGEGYKEHGLRWDVVRREDCPLIASRTKLPKVEATLMSEPSVAVRDAEGTLVAWGFMGVAGTLSTLHVEEPYRGKGIAKAVATKVFREHSFGDDGWGSADVHVDNVQSQAVCKSLGAEYGWKTCWTVIDFNSIP